MGVELIPASSFSICTYLRLPPYNFLKIGCESARKRSMNDGDGSMLQTNQVGRNLSNAATMAPLI